MASARPSPRELIDALHALANPPDNSGIVEIAEQLFHSLEHSEGALRIQADVSELLTASLDYTENLGRAAKRLVPDLADAVLIDLVEERGVCRLVEASVGGDESDSGVRRIPWEPQGSSAIARALASRECVVEGVADFGALGPLEHPAGDDGCLLIAPVATGERIIGALTLVRSPRHEPCDDDDLALLQDLGRRMAMAVENGRLLEGIERAVQTREDALAIVCHDLRNPLNAIRTNTDVLLLNAPSSDRRSGRRQLDAIKRGTERIGLMVGDLLDRSRIEGGHFRVDVADVGVTELVRGAVGVLGPTAALKDVNVRVDLPQPALMVRCDRERTLQVIQNVLANAIRFTPTGGTITIAAALTGATIRFDVTDTGSGIDAARLPHIFDRYWQAPEDQHLGRGLGLYVSKGILTAMDGRIWAVSEPGTGTTISWVLPAAPAAVPAPPVSQKNEGVVLLVDDEADNREAVRGVLEDEGHNVIEACDGREALEIMRQTHPALVLLDLRMPVLDGWGVLAARTCDPDLLEIPVVLVSGTHHLRAEAMRSRASGFLEKPVRLDTLIEMVAQHKRAI